MLMQGILADYLKIKKNRRNCGDSLVRKVSKEACSQESRHFSDERFKKIKRICKNRFLKPGKIPVEEWNTSCFSYRENGLL